MPDEPRIFILDGGLGTTLEEKYHISFSSAETPLWSSHLLLTDQQTLLQCHDDFARAGADIITTATYQASAAGFADTRTPEWHNGVPRDRVPQLVRDAVRLASRSVGDHPAAVALSLGPYGATMVPSQEYGGKYDEGHCGVEVLMAWHLERMILYAKAPGLFAGVEYLAFETVPRLDEVLAIRRMMEDLRLHDRMTEDRPVKGRLPYWLSCVFPREDEDGEPLLPDGTPAKDAVRAMLDPEVSSVVPWGIGINCTKVEKLPALVKIYEDVVTDMASARQLDEWPSLVLYPDGTNGEVYNTVTQKWELPAGVKAPLVSTDLFSRYISFCCRHCYVLHSDPSLTRSSNRGRVKFPKLSGLPEAAAGGRISLPAAAARQLRTTLLVFALQFFEMPPMGIVPDSVQRRALQRRIRPRIPRHRWTK